MPAIRITLTSVLPEGFSGTPQQFIDAFCENARFEAIGAFITGQDGGATPTANVGLWIDDRQLKVWDGSKYAPISTVPIGAVLDYPTGLLTPPDNYLFCDVSPADSLVDIEDYPELYEVIGRIWSKDEDPITKFRLPPFAGRASVGAGTGKYDPKETGIEPGNMLSHVVGDLFGHEWITGNSPTQDGAPTGRFSSPSTKIVAANKTFYHGVSQPSIVVRKIIRYR